MLLGRMSNRPLFMNINLDGNSGNQKLFSIDCVEQDKGWKQCVLVDVLACIVKTVIILLNPEENMTLWCITGNVLAQAVHASLFIADNSYYYKCLETTYRPTFLPISLSLNLDCKC